jgi:hypothetical protein
MHLRYNRPLVALAAAAGLLWLLILVGLTLGEVLSRHWPTRAAAATIASSLPRAPNGALPLSLANSCTSYRSCRFPPGRGNPPPEQELAKSCPGPGVRHANCSG